MPPGNDEHGDLDGPEPLTDAPAEPTLSSAADALAAEIAALQAARQSAGQGQPGAANPADVGTDCLLELLHLTAALLQVTIRRQESRKDGNGPTTEAPERDPSWECVHLVAMNLIDRPAAERYARVLERLDSVQEVLLQQVDETAAHYQVWTTSNARLTRGILAAPEHRPARVQTSRGQVTVTLEREPGTPPSPAVSALLPAPQPGASTDPANGATSGAALEVGVNGFFNARHYLPAEGEPGPVEMRSWQVDFSWEGDQFDDCGRLVGFEAAQVAVAQLLSGYNNVLLNRVPPFDTLPPTPENLARTLYQQIAALTNGQSLRLKGLKVWATPTQYVVYAERGAHAP